MARAKNIVYLYSEVMPYAIAVVRALVNEFAVEVDCICWDQNKRTPFVPVDEPGIKFHKRSGFNRDSIIQFIEERNPSLMYVSGRMDPLYLEAALHFKKKCCVVTGSDNQWTGSMKQRLAAILSPVLYKKYFEYFWVPGPRQVEYARRMGYPDNKILRNHLSADTFLFRKAYWDNGDIKRSRYPHNMVFAGRFSYEKGLDILIEAFSEARKELQNDWKLTLIGSGDIPVSSEAFIEIKGFMSGEELAGNCGNWGVFCLPSLREPWGVVIHEFTSAGLPIICSDSVGAADVLVVDNDNGFVFKSGDKHALKQAIKRMMNKSDTELVQMGDKSYVLSEMNSPVIAARSLMSVIENDQNV